MKRGSAAWALGCVVLLAAPGSALAGGQSAGSGEGAGSSAAVKPASASTPRSDTTTSSQAAERAAARGSASKPSTGNAAERGASSSASTPSTGNAAERGASSSASTPSTGNAAERAAVRGASSSVSTPSPATSAERGSKPPSSPKSKAGAPNKPPAQTDAQSAPRFVWPSLRVLEQVDASEVVEAGGVPVVLRAVVVKDSVQDLVQRFADAFRAGGLHVPPGNEQPQLASGAAMLTAVDMYRGLTFTVILQPQEGGVTLVYLGEANHTLRREPSAEGDVATLPPGAHQVLRVNDEGSRTMSFLAPMSASEVDAFYAQVLGRDGWRRAEGDASSYTRASEELRVIHEPAEGGLRSVVLILRGRARAAQGTSVP